MRVPKNEVKSGLERILRGISSRIAENINRCAIRLDISVHYFGQTKDELNRTWQY